MKGSVRRVRSDGGTGEGELRQVVGEVGGEHLLRRQSGHSSDGNDVLTVFGMREKVPSRRKQRSNVRRKSRISQVQPHQLAERIQMKRKRTPSLGGREVQ